MSEKSQKRPLYVGEVTRFDTETPFVCTACYGREGKSKCTVCKGEGAVTNCKFCQARKSSDSGKDCECGGSRLLPATAKQREEHEKKVRLGRDRPPHYF